VTGRGDNEADERHGLDLVWCGYETIHTAVAKTGIRGKDLFFVSGARHWIWEGHTLGALTGRTKVLRRGPLAVDGVKFCGGVVRAEACAG
jgi:hypothetical protein